MRRFRITEPTNLQRDRTVNKHAIAKKKENTGDLRNIPKERDEGDDRENNPSDDDTGSSTRRDFDLGVIQEVRSRIDG